VKLTNTFQFGFLLKLICTQENKITVPQGFEYNGRSYEGLRQTFQKMKSEFLKSSNGAGLQISPSKKAAKDDSNDEEDSKPPFKPKPKTPRKRKAPLKADDSDEDGIPVADATPTPAKAKKPRAKKAKAVKSEDNILEDNELKLAEEESDNGDAMAAQPNGETEV
jgi:hypothetical protein